MEQALEWLDERLGQEAVDRALRRLPTSFRRWPSIAARSTWTPTWRGETGGVSHRQILLEEMLMLWLANAQPGLCSLPGAV
jgi:hypothetical protein